VSDGGAKGRRGRARSKAAGPAGVGGADRPEESFWSDELPAEVQGLIGRFERACAELRQEADREADEVRRRAEEELSAIRRRAEESMRSQLADLVREVKPIQEEYVRAGKLDEALTIRERLRQLRSTTAQEVRPDPGILYVQDADHGKSFLYEVTGSTQGPVWGTDVYSSDSSLAAAVHAGALRRGERGVVRVEVLDRMPASFQGSNRHGVRSGPWQGSYPAFRVSRA
jgi:ElaB/YqjD/DUF883 family membrane-anchored ribosome-binding protein